MGWVSPTGHVDSGSHWTDESKAYDENTSTYAIYDLLATGYWTSFLELTHASIVCNSVRFMLPQDTHGGYIYLDIDVYYSGAWHDVYSGTFSNLTWAEKSLGGNFTVTALRIRVYNGTGGGQSLRFHEAAFYQVVAPTVTTQACTAVTGQTATGNGNITATGGANATRRGFCYKTGTSGDPTVSDSKVYDTGSFGTGAFSKSISGLSPGTGYRVRAYAINSIGTSYGTTVQLTTDSPPTVTTQAVTAIGSVVATGNGNITATGGENATERGVCYNTTGSPTTSDSKIPETGDFGTGAFTSSMTGLSPGVKYYVKAYAISSAGTGYGAEVNFTTDKVAPTVTTQAPTDVLPTTVTANGNITATGGESATVRGFKYGLTKVDTWSASDSGTYSAGAYTKGLTSLSANTTYWIRAYATNGIDTSYGEWVEFQTAAVGVIPTGTKINICSDYSGYTFQIDGALTDDGESYESYFVLSTDLSGGQTLHTNKRLLDIFTYFINKGSGTADIYVKRDTEAAWQLAGEVTMSGEQEIIIKHLPVDYLAKTYLFKFVFENDFEFVGVITEAVAIGDRPHVN